MREYEPPVVEHQPLNLCGEKTIWQGPHVANWIRHPALGVSLLHSIMPVKK